MRARERDRRHTTRRLRAAYLDGALSTSTFELRVGRAVGARYREELAELLGDLRTRPWRRWLAGLAPRRPAVATVDVKLPAYEGETLLVGRGADADAVIDDPLVSRRHALITARAGEWRVLDLESRNGVYLNGRRVRSARVDVGDVLELGGSAMRLDEPPSGEGSQPPESALSA